MGFYPPDSLVHEAQRRGIRVAPPDANRSRVLCHVERRARSRSCAAGWWCGSGSATSRGCAKEEMEALVAERERGGPYRGIAELASRSGAGLPSLERLAWAGALDGIPRRRGGDRRGRSGGSGSPPPAGGARAAPSWRCRSSRPPRPSWSRWASGGS